MISPIAARCLQRHGQASGYIEIMTGQVGVYKGVEAWQLLFVKFYGYCSIEAADTIDAAPAARLLFYGPQKYRSLYTLYSLTNTLPACCKKAR